MNKSTFIVKSAAVFIVLASFALNSFASAVRPFAVTRSNNGLLLGGTMNLPMGGSINQGSSVGDVSADGNIIVFSSSNAPSVFDPTVGDFFSSLISNVFVRDLRTGETRCLSKGLFEGAIRSFGGIAPRISPNGRYVVYAGPDPSRFSNIFHVWIHDLVNDTKDIVSIAPNGAAGNLDSRYAVVSDDGRYVGFMSTASNLVNGYTGSGLQIYVRDMQQGVTHLASHAANSTTAAGNGTIDFSSPLSMSGNGRFTVWTSNASNHSPFVTDNNGANDVFYFDVTSSGSNIGVASVTQFGLTTGNGASRDGMIAANSGSFPPTIVFSSNASNIHTADTNPATDIYRLSSTVELVSISRTGTAANGAAGRRPYISRNGRFVSFTSVASDLVTGFNEPNNTTSDAFLRDMQTGATEYISLNASNSPSATAQGAVFPNGESTQNPGPASYTNKMVSDDGRYVAFYTAEPMSVRDSGTTMDPYVRDRSSGVTILASTGTSLNTGQNSSTEVGDVILAANGRKAFFSTRSTNLAADDTTSIENPKSYMANISLLSERSTTDLDGDAKNDYSVFRPSEGAWYSLFDINSTAFESFYFGASGDRLVPGDYDGDGKSDYAIFMPASGRWDILMSRTNEVVTRFFGTASDVMVPADYDGDGKTDLAYFRPANASWNIIQSNNNSLRTIRFGLPTDIPVPGDYDGDNKADVAVFRTTTGDWWIQRSTTNALYMNHWGLGTDKPVQADYDGDGKTDLAVFRDGTWYVLNSRDSSFRGEAWGLPNDKLVPADYDGDGRADLAIYRESEGNWYVLQSTNNTYVALHWGMSGDIPATGAYRP